MRREVPGSPLSRIAGEGAERRGREAGEGNPPLALPDKPSIAVLPFANMSGDPEQDYFADGMVEMRMLRCHLGTLDRVEVTAAEQCCSPCCEPGFEG